MEWQIKIVLNVTIILIIVATNDGRSLFVNYEEIKNSRHSNTACSQCHTEVNVSHNRPCETIKNAVDCSACHAEIGVRICNKYAMELLLQNEIQMHPIVRNAMELMEP